MSKPYSSNKHSLEYLHENNRPTLDAKQFLDTHIIYRGKPDRNPMDLAYPNSTITELSCNWSKFIVAGDSLRLRPKDKFIFYTNVKEIKDFKIEFNKNDGSGYDGDHKLTCVLYHSPLDINYSHVQIDIEHGVKCENPQLDKIIRYTKDNWKKGANLLRKKNNDDVKKFFKNLREEYKFQLAQLFDELPIGEHFLYDAEFIKDNPSFDTSNQISATIAQFSATPKPSASIQPSTTSKLVPIPQRMVGPQQKTIIKNDFWNLLKFVQDSSSNLKSRLIKGIASIFRKK